MSNSAYNMHASSKAKAIAERFKNLLPDEANTHVGPVPHFKNDYPERISIEKNSQQSTGPSAIIDVQPDFRNIIQYICYYVTKLYNQFDVRPQPFITPPSLTAYCLALVYGYGLLNDEENVRTEESHYAQDFNATYGLDDAKTQIRNMFVPNFMIPLLNGLSVTADERRPELKFVYSLASFDLEYDFGRTIPISVFITAHNILASQAANQAPSAIYDKWHNTTIVEVPTQLKVANYLGVGRTPDHENWFSQLCGSLFNPVTMRTNSIRPVFGQIQFESQELEDNMMNINPYIHLLSLDATNARTTTKAFRDMSQSIHEISNANVKLGTVEYESKGNQLISHYYSRFQIPTYHFDKIADTATRQPGKLKTFVKTHKILTMDEINPTNELADPGDKTLYSESIYLTNLETYVPRNDPDQPKEFNIYTDVLDSVRHLSPYETKREELFFNIIHGKVIESEEIDSICVPQPNPDNSIAVENSYFLESAVPFTQITPMTGRDIHLYQRKSHSVTKPVIRAVLYDRSQDWLPTFTENVTHVENSLLRGFTRTPDIPSGERACNSIAFQIKSETTSTVIPAITRKIYAWSCYRYINTKQDSTVPIRNKKLMLLNLRSLFGTNATLVETPNPSAIIPQS